MTNKGKAAKLKPPKIDYPKVNEAISAGHYAVRVSAAQDEQVEISLDGGTWAPCFNSSGYWWFHLNGLAAGTHKLAARVKVSGETFFAMRKFEVKKPG
jgi:hypothetical protein